MNNLIQLENKNNIVVMSAKILAKEIGKSVSDVNKRIGDIILDLQNSNPDSAQNYFIKDTFIGGNNRKYDEWFLTKDGFTLYMFNIQGYNDFKMAYINRFNEMERALQQQFKVPTSFKEALQLALEQQEKIEALELKQKQDKPKVLFASSVETSKTTILIGDLAKIIKQNGVDIGQKRLFSWLRDNGYLIKRNGVEYNMPTQKSMDLGLFEIKETTITHSDGHITVNKTPKITGRGQIYFINKFIK